MSSTVHTSTLKGGEFLLFSSHANAVFTPEDFSEDQLMMQDMVQDFVDTRVKPNMNRIDHLDLKFSRDILSEMGELGIVGLSFPEEFGGSGMDFVSSMLLSELLAQTHSFSTTFNAHTGIGMLPILYFGTEAQKQQYLPDLVAGKKIAAYCLTEPGSGSDALAAKTSAVLSEDGNHYLLNGQKMWITNAGIADVFIVFAKIDGKHFTGFIVERDWEGVELGEEEEKMGIKGSSTRQIFFEKVKVPKDNLLGAPGKGHKIAFNILNIGRLKLAAGAIGGSKEAANLSVQYAIQRQQFGQPISNFGAIQHKLAEQAIRIFAAETAAYRAAEQIELHKEKLLQEGKSMGEASLGGAEEFSIECAILKVQGSECLDYTVDEGVQIYGGMGYSEEAPMACLYRDARINRIFEGTNEINRILTMDMLLKRTLSGHIKVLNPANEPEETPAEGPFARERQMIHQMKKAFRLLTGAVIEHFGQELAGEQEILMYLSDIMADIYLAESALLRTEKKAARQGREAAADFADLSRVFLEDAMERLMTKGRRAISSWAEGKQATDLLESLRVLAIYQDINTKAARRRIARRLIESGKYCF